MAKKDKATGATLQTDADKEPKESKSIVPSKYAGKYKGGGQGPTSDFIRSQCGEGDKFEFPAFFIIARKNGIAEDKVALYEGQVADKTQGANGRARMTLGNMLRAIARKNQKLVGLNGDEWEVPEAKLEATGAAAKAKEAAAGNAASAPTGSEAGSEATT